jgi:hypothetical protein
LYRYISYAWTEKKDYENNKKIGGKWKRGLPDYEEWGRGVAGESPLENTQQDKWWEEQGGIILWHQIMKVIHCRYGNTSHVSREMRKHISWKVLHMV